MRGSSLEGVGGRDSVAAHGRLGAPAAVARAVQLDLVGVVRGPLGLHADDAERHGRGLALQFGQAAELGVARLLLPVAHGSGRVLEPADDLGAGLRRVGGGGGGCI